jgi:curved DNA-binding protein CbpA
MGKATISPAAGTGLLAELGRDSGITWYDVLGVLPGATAEQVQYQHDAKARLLRPEMVAGAPSPVVAAASRARDILGAARRVLADPASRARAGFSPQHGQAHRASAAGGRPCRPPVSRAGGAGTEGQ